MAMIVELRWSDEVNPPRFHHARRRYFRNYPWKYHGVVPAGVSPAEYLRYLRRSWKQDRVKHNLKHDAEIRIT